MFPRPSNTTSYSPSDVSSRRAVASTRTPAVPPPPLDTHRATGRWLDCLICLCPRLRRPAADRPAGATPAANMATTATTTAPTAPTATELRTFRPPGDPPKETVQVTPLKMHPYQACFQIQPAGFLKRDALLAYRLPQIGGQTPYHECHDGAPSGLHMINVLGMALTGNHYGVLASRTQLDDFVRARHGCNAGDDYLDEDLRDFHNHGRRTRPALALATAAVMPDGAIAFDSTYRTADATDTTVAAEIDAAPAVGLSFHFADGERATLNSVVVRRTGETAFELLDSRRLYLYYTYARHMTTALGIFVRKLGTMDPDEPPVLRYSMLYPTAAPPVPLGPLERLTWL